MRRVKQLIYRVVEIVGCDQRVDSHAVDQVNRVDKAVLVICCSLYAISFCWCGAFVEVVR